MKLKSKILKNIHILVLFLLSLTPLIWFIKRGNVLITGLDTNFPLNPLIWFGRRFFVWNSTINAGTDFSSSMSGIFFHLIQTIPYSLKLNLQVSEIVSLIFWFFVIVFGAYLFARSIFPKIFIGQLVFVIIYSFNIYLFNTWENVKVSNLSLVAALPFFLWIIFSLKKNTLSFPKALFYSAIGSLIASGGGVNPAYFLSLVAALFLFIFVSFSFDFKDSKIYLFRCLSCLLVVFLMNLFWILPLTNQLFVARRVGSLSDIGLANWVDSLSKDTNLFNVLRLQGAWDWYIKDNFGLPLYIPYAIKYFNSIPFIIFSLFIPILSLLSLLNYKKEDKILYITFGILLILGVFLAAGSHEPTGAIYRLLDAKVPFFSFFRSPWYIFTPYIIISTASLSLLLIKRLFEKFENKKLIYVFAIIFILGNLIYSYPLVLGKIFRPGRYDSFYVKFPSYVFDASNWLNQKNTQRVITYPDDQLETFKWGYRGTESILDLFSNVEVITPSFNYNNLNLLLNRFYFNIKKGDYASSFSIMPFLGADTVFNKKDADSLSRAIDESDKTLIDQTSKTSFGDWSFLKINQKIPGKIYSPQIIYDDLGQNQTFADLIPTINPNSIIINTKDTEVAKIGDMKNQAYSLLVANNTNSDQNLVKNLQKYTINLLKDGTYDLLIERKGAGADIDNFSGALVTIDSGNAISITTDDTKGDFFTLKSVNLKKGIHQITIDYPEQKNLLESIDILQYNNKELSLRNEELPTDLKKVLVAFDSNAANGSMKIPVPNFDPFRDYLLEFDSKYFYGNVPIIDVLQSAPSSPVKAFPLFGGSSVDWEHKSEPINPVQIDSKLEIFVRTGSNKDNRSKAFIENFSVKKVNDNKVYLKQTGDAQLIPPQIKMEKVSPVEYNFHVDSINGPYFVVFLESYDPGWRITTDNGDIPIHFSANGYANAWYLSGSTTSQKLKIYYEPQKYFLIGSFISSLTFVAVLVFLFKKWKK